MTGFIEQKKVLIVSQYFWPEDFRVNELVLGLKKKGCIVEVLTSTPNYPLGQIFKEYKKNPGKYTHYNSIYIHRVSQISRGNNKFTLVLNYLSFLISASFYCLCKLRKKNYDVIFAIQLSPIFSVIPAIICKKLFKSPLFFWVLDVWPDSITPIKINTNSYRYKLLERICYLLYSSADFLLLSSKGFESRLSEMGVIKPKMIYFPNWVEDVYSHDLNLDSDEGSKVKSLLSRWSDKKIFLFAGNLGEAQDFPNLLKGFKDSSSLGEVVFLIIGDGRYKESLISIINSYNLKDNVFLLGRYESSYMPYFYYYADILVFSLLDIPIFKLTLPGKVQSYMSSGSPIVGMVNGEAELLIKEAKCGYSAASGDTKHLSILIDRCCSSSEQDLKQLGLNGKIYAHDNFDYNSLMSKVVSYF